MTNQVCGILTSFQQLKRGYSDQTGRFPYKSSQGNEYIMIVYDYNSNAILCEPLKSKAAAVIRNGWGKIHKKLCKRGVAPELYILDNEISKKLKFID